MKRKPTEIEVLHPKSSYEVPKYKVTENGLENAGVEVIRFVKGSKSDPTVFRQQGLVTESLVSVVLMYLEENNVGNLQNSYTDEMIQHLQAVLDLINQRAAERSNRGVQGTYNK